MFYKGFVLSLLAVSLVAAGSIRYEHQHANHDMLLKQKKLFDILLYVNQNVLTDAEYYEVGRNYDILNNIDHYSNQQVVKDFMVYYNLEMLQRDSIFTPYNEQHREEMLLLFRLFYSARDFNTFYKTASWARLHLNPMLFTTAFTTAVIYRDDTKFIRLPAIYEIYPNIFFDSKVIRQAQHIIMTRGLGMHGGQLNLRSQDIESVETFHVYSNMSDLYSPVYSYENQLNYLVNDVGLNAYYYYFRMMFPFWMNTKEYNVPHNLRGDLYFYVHQQLLARYYLERISNGLREIEEFSLNNMHLPGFYGNYLYHNGIAIPNRDFWTSVPYYKQRYLEYLRQLEIRIMEVIDSGYVIDSMGKQVSIMSNEGLNILGNLIEGNYDSINLQYYGSYDVLARNIFGMNYNINNRDYYIPSSLQFFSTSLRDPAFYRIYNRIVQYYLRYQSHLNRYTQNELEFNGVRIENVEVDKLYTYFDAQNYLINNAIDVPTMKNGMSYKIKAWQYQLNYKPFTYKINVNSDRSTKAVVRIFLGPAIEGEKYDDYSYLLNYYRYFFQLDEFEVNLREGLNNIDRLSTDSVLFQHEYLTGDKFYKQVLQAIEGQNQLVLTDRIWGFPANLLLPKGTVDGMRFKLFVYIGQHEEGKLINLPIFGNRVLHGQSLGFPLDRPMNPWFLKLGNVFFKDVYIYNQVNEEISGSVGRTYNRMSNVESWLYNRQSHM